MTIPGRDSLFGSVSRKVPGYGWLRVASRTYDFENVKCSGVVILGFNRRPVDIRNGDFVEGRLLNSEGLETFRSTKVFSPLL